MKKTSRTYVKRLLLRVGVPLAKLVARSQKEVYKEQNEALKQRLQICGEDVEIHERVVITEPRGVSLGNNVHIGSDCFIHSEGGLQIGDNVHLSRRITIYCSDHQFRGEEPVPYGPKRTWRQVRIGRNAWIGMNACILPGVTIGEGAIIGMGAVIARDVPPFAIVGQQPYRVLGERPREEYDAALDAGRIGGVNGTPVPRSRLDSYPRSGRSKRPEMCFVLTSGRSGSTSIADMLKDNPRVDARHEPRLQLIEWSTRYAHGDISREDLMALLEELFLDNSAYRDGIIRLESDQKHFNLVPLLDELFPEARYVWLIRSGVNVVASATGRSWYADDSHKVWKRIPWYYQEFRVRGDLTGDVSAGEWAAMSPFERNCWYWHHINRVIETDLAAIPDDRKLRMRLEDFDQQSHRLLDLLDLPGERQAVSKSNRAGYAIHDLKAWSEAEKAAFSKWCGEQMARIYPDVTW